MNSEIKYPYIGEHATLPIINLFTREGFFIRLDDPESFDGKEYPHNSDELLFSDITKKYLSNTWGMVESKEHAEFIIELAELHGVKVFMPIGNVNHFIIRDGLSFHNCEKIKSTELKQITIPLPPKAKVKKPDFSELPKHFDCRCNKCDGKCCTGFCDKSWPQVGDPVTVFGQQGVLALPADKNGMYVVKSNGRYFIPKLSDMGKPKSKEDLLIEELQAKLVNNNAVDNYILACDIINGDIEGLSYNTEESK